MLALTSLTAVQRFVMVWRQANRAGHGPPPPERRVFVRRGSYDRDPSGLGSLAMSARWRAWREANGWVPRADRYADGSRRTGATVRWHERRQARIARMNESNGDRAAATPFRRRTGTRRP
jgi:hypothetical protein